MDWLKYKNLYFLVSVVMIGVSVYSLLTWGLKLGVDFKGGSIIEYKFENSISTEDATRVLKSEGIEVTTIQSTGESTYLFKFPPLDEEKKEKIASIAAGLVGENDAKESTGSGEIISGADSLQDQVLQAMPEELRFENVGPSIGPELIKKTIYAILVAAIAILLWVAYQFKSIKFGASAILAMFHDSFILIGAFSLLGHFFAVEIDFLFVTALLTTLSFSVHDTIVVFDRIREIGPPVRRTSGPEEEFTDTANRALTETMVRSLNNSFTIIFMLTALLLLGGTTIKWFAVALLVGTILGTYSSPFVAVPLLVTWDSLLSKSSNIRKKIKLPKRK